MFEQLSGLLIGVTGTPPWLLRFVRVSNSYQLYPDCYPSLCSTCVTYGTLCHAIGHQLLPTHPFTASATDLRERFLLSGVFYLALLPAVFKASLGAGSSTSRLAGLHGDLRTITPARLFVWITAIHKRFILVGSI